MIGDTPTIMGYNYGTATSTVGLNHLYAGNAIAGGAGNFLGAGVVGWNAENSSSDTVRRVMFKDASPTVLIETKKQEVTTMAKRRLVQVFIADPNENVPLEKAMIYRGEPKFTDATDQELFFEIEINALLKTYNEERVKVVDRKVKDRTEFLEPVKIRELKMVVVTIAEF